MTRRPQDVNPSPHSSFKSWKSAMNLFLPFKWAFLFVPVIFATPSTRPFERRSWESVELAQMQVPVLQVKKWKRKPVKKVLETATNLPPLWLGCLPDPTFCLFEQLPLVCVLAMLKLEACFAGAISNECWLDTTAVCYLRMLITFQRVQPVTFHIPICSIDQSFIALPHDHEISQDHQFLSLISIINLIIDKFVPTNILHLTSSWSMAYITL